MQSIVADFFEDSFLKSLEIKDIKQLFEYLAQKEYERKLIIIIDEFQYLTKLDNFMPSRFQYIVDELLKNKNIYLILCGSIILMMYEQTLSYNSPLYGRRTSDIKLEAIEFNYLKEFYPKNQMKNLLNYIVYSTVYQNI